MTSKKNIFVYLFCWWPLLVINCAHPKPIDFVIANLFLVLNQHEELVLGSLAVILHRRLGLRRRC
jgi:hypothetical protein